MIVSGAIQTDFQGEKLDAVPPIRRHRPSLVVLSLALLAACGGPFPQSTLAPVSDFGRDIDKLFTQIFWWAVVVFVLVEGLLLYAVFRFRHREGAPHPKQREGHTALEIAWTLAPALILVFIAVPTVLTIFKTSGHAPEGAIRVEVIGHQWWWEYRYPDLGIVTANELHVPVGRPVAVDITSADVIHSWWTPRLGGKRDATPHRHTRLAFTPDSIGAYLGQCVEYCGASHANMRLRTFVESEADFQAWVAAQAAAAPTPATGSPEAAGRAAFQRYGCIGCHTVAGFSTGALGPNLTHVGSRTTIASGTMMNTEEHLRSWIADPPAMKPGSMMPRMGVPPADLPNLVAYLMSLK
jgi:cytochrome c oxidase subunit 2